MLEYNEVTHKKHIIFNGEPFEVVSSHVSRKQARRPVNQTKLRNLISGNIVEQAFHQTEKIKEADIETRVIKYLYTSKGESWFCDPKNPANRYALNTNLLDNKEGLLKANTLVDALTFNDTTIGIRLPIKIDLLVKEAPPAVRGNTVQGGTKQVILETGATIDTPMFINEGDLIRINTETGLYAERVEKAG
jgi:elongation factor P